MRQTDLGQLVCGHPVFTDAPPGVLARVLARATLRTLSRGQALVRDGEPATEVHVVVEGALRVFHTSPDGEEAVVMLLRAHALYGDSEAVAGGRYVESVAAHDRAVVVSIPADAFTDFLGHHPMAAVRLLCDAAQRRAISAYQEKSLAFLPVTIRLANFLVDCLEQQAPPDLLHLTQDEMAAAISATRRSVAKDMIAWQEAGVLVREGGRYRVRDPQTLRRYADPSRLSRSFPAAAMAA
jgi:CRP/FNR family transcriptional regulator, cyclic AMP receptor protein